MNIKIIVFVVFYVCIHLIKSDDEIDCPNANRDKTLNIHSWKFYDELNDAAYFFKNGSTAAWIMGVAKAPFLYICSGPATEEPILAINGSSKKVSESPPITIDMMVNRRFVDILHEILKKEKAFDLEEANECILKDFQKIYESLAWTAGSKATLKDLHELKDAFMTSNTGPAKEFYDKGGSITLTKDIIWITNVVQAIGELVKDNEGILEKLQKEDKLDFDEQKILNEDTPGDALKEILKEISKSEDLSKIIGDKSEAKEKITAALKLFHQLDGSPEEIAESLVNEFYD